MALTIPRGLMEVALDHSRRANEVAFTVTNDYISPIRKWQYK